MVELAVLADTHIPSRAATIPEWVAARVRRADHAVHAGDFDSTEAYARVDDLAGGDLTAVRGNMDPPSISVPRVATREFAGVRFVVTHGTGAPGGWADRVAGTVHEEAGDVGIAAHTHQVVDRHHDDVRLLNPGSATGAAPADETSMMTVTVEDGSLDIEVVRR